MANSEQSLNLPVIYEVMDPSVNQHVVMVRMATRLKIKHPDKPWGTSIADIGLAPKDAEMYPGYTLVDFEPIKGTNDLFWIFQNLTTSPVWTTSSLSREDLIPQKFRSQVSQTKTKQDVAPDTAPDALIGNVIASTVEQQESTGKAVKITITEVVSASARPLTGKKSYVERETATTTEALVNDGAATTTGLKVVESQVIPLGNGKSIKEDVIVDTWHTLKGSEWNDELQAQIQYTEQYVDPPNSSALALKNTSHKIVNKDRSMRIVEIVPTDALNNYSLSYPTRVNLELPNILTNVYVMWNLSASSGDQDSEWEGISVGSSYSLSCSQGDRSTASAAVSPEVIYDMEETVGKDLPATAHYCYMKLPITEAQLLTKFGAQRWPVFKPRSHIIATVGQNLSVAANVQISAASSGSQTTYSRDAGKSESSEVSASLSNGAIRIPASIHPTIVIGGETMKTASAAAHATLSCSGDNFPSVNASKSAAITAVGGVYPTVLERTEVTDIPRSGKYLVNSTVKPYKWGYAMVYAEIFDASVLARSSGPTIGRPQF